MRALSVVEEHPVVLPIRIELHVMAPSDVVQVDPSSSAMFILDTLRCSFVLMVFRSVGFLLLFFLLIGCLVLLKRLNRWF